MTHEEILGRFVNMPGQLEAALAGLPEAALDWSRTAEAWTIRQIVHHVIDADDMTSAIIKAAVGKSGCVYALEWYDPANMWAQTLAYARRPITPGLALLRANHSHLEELLRHLPEAWDRHVLLQRFAGSEANKITVAQLMHSQTSHAFHHIEQIHITRRRHGR